MKYVSPEAALIELRHQHPGPARIYVAGCSGEPLAMASAFQDAPYLADGLTFLGVWIPGVNTTDWAGLTDTAQAESIFLSAKLRSSFERRQTRFLPLSYMQAWQWLEHTPLNAAVIMLSPPSAAGKTTLGVSTDFSPAILNRKDVFKIGLINPNMPATVNGHVLDINMFDLVCEAGVPLVQSATKGLSPSFKRLGANVAALIEDGDTLQFGLGNLQQSVLQQLTAHQNLQVHSGMISDPLLDLLDCGAIASKADAVTTGVAIGTNTLYSRVAANKQIRFCPVEYTHAITTLGAIPCFKAINSVIEVDLFGQANAEFINGQQVSGTGGLVDFLRGGRISQGGRAITGLLSTAKSGKISRIVPRLPMNAVSITRADMDTVVTEHGVVNLRDQSLDARAEALISIAAPAFRSELANAWEKIRRSM